MKTRVDLINKIFAKLLELHGEDRRELCEGAVKTLLIQTNSTLWKTLARIETQIEEKERLSM